MAYQEFDVGAKKKRNVMVTECPLLVAILALLDAFVIYFVAGVIVEVIIGSIPLITGATFLAKDVRSKKIRWWPIALAVVGTVTLVLTWAFPFWLFLAFSNAFSASLFVIAWGVFISGIIISEVARKKKAEWEAFKKQAPVRGSITDPGNFLDLEISSPKNVGNPEKVGKDEE